MRSNKLVAATVMSLLVVGLAACSSTASADPKASGGDTSSSAPKADTPAQAGADPVFVDSAPDGGPTMAMKGDSFDPATLTIKAGDTVKFTSGDDGIHGLVAGSLASVTVAKGMPEFYRFTEAGSYTVKDEISEATATITVE